jgi:hypothetical protein
VRAGAIKPTRIAGVVLVALLLGVSHAGSGRAQTAPPPGCTANAAGWICTLTVTASPGGTTTSSDQGINCGTDCTQGYQLGPNNQFVSITLTATAGAGWQFSSWSGCTAVQGNVCTLRMNQSTTVTPTFTRTSYRLTVTAAGTGNGAVTGSGIACPGDCVEDFKPGDSVVLTQTTGSGSVWTGWSGSCSGTAATCAVTMSADRNVTATFNAASVSPATFTLTVSVSGTGNGKVTGSGIDCPGDCTESYAAGTAVTLTAVPVGNATIQWSGDCAGAGSAATCGVAVSQARAVGVTFTPVATPAGPTPIIDQSYKEPPPQLPPAVEQVIVKVDGTGRVTSSPARVLAGAGGATSINCGSLGGPPKFDCLGEYRPGQTLTLNAQPGGGYVFKRWTGACAGSGPTCRVSTRDSRTTTAVFEQGGTGSAVAALLRPPNLRVRWLSSIGAGNLVLRGSTSLPATARVDMRRPGGGPLATLKLKLGGGSFRELLALKKGALRGGAKLLPGGFTVALTGRAGRLKLPLQMQTISIPAPTEGVVRRAFKSRAQNGKAVTRFAAGTKRAWANFRFETQPLRNQKLYVRWYFPDGRLVGQVEKSNRPVISSYLALETGLPRGLWVAELRTGKRVIQRLSLRVG